MYEPTEERPCCQNCAYLRGDWSPYNCAYKLDVRLDELYSQGKELAADDVLKLAGETTVEDWDYCPHWRWYGDE